MKHLCILLFFASVMLSAADTAKSAPAAAKPAEAAKPAAAATTAKPAATAKADDDKPASVLTPLFHIDLDPAAFADQEKAETLIRQVTSSVLFEASLNYLISEGFTRFIELGPGTVLCGFLKRISKEVQILNVSDLPSLEQTVAALQADHS